MRTYPIYLESGPRRRRTMVHVLDLLGCTASGATTDEALGATGEAIRGYLSWLRRASILYASPMRAQTIPHAEEPFELVVAEHLTVGRMLGNGSPSVTFKPEFEPLGVPELRLYVERLEWQRTDLLSLLQEYDDEQLDVCPPQGRTVREILMHIIESDIFFISTITSLPSPRRFIRRDAHIFEKLTRIRTIVLENLYGLTEDERSRVNQRGRETWTARKAIRRCLEHEFEHLREVASRRTVLASIEAHGAR